MHFAAELLFGCDAIRNQTWNAAEWEKTSSADGRSGPLASHGDRTPSFSDHGDADPILLVGDDVCEWAK